MAECECLPKCPFFNDRMLEKPVTTKMMKAQYCLGSNIECARHQVFKALGSENVPSDLYPSQRERSLQIIKTMNQSRYKKEHPFLNWFSGNRSKV